MLLPYRLYLEGRYLAQLVHRFRQIAPQPEEIAEMSVGVPYQPFLRDKGAAERQFLE